jgi:hypothetical protein
MATSAKAIAIARELVDVWQKKVATTLPVLVESLDTDGNPVITMSADSSPAFGEKVVVVRVKPMTWTAYDIIGHVSPVYAQHVIQVCTEANYASTNDNIADILTPVELLPIWAEIAKRACQMEWYVSANGTVPSTAQMTSGNLVKSDKDLYWNALKSQ